MMSLVESACRQPYPVQAGDPSQRGRVPNDDGKQQIEPGTRDPESDFKCPNPQTTANATLEA